MIGHELQKNKKNKEYRSFLTRVQHRENGKLEMANGFKWSIGPNLKMESSKWILVTRSEQKNYEIYISEYWNSFSPAFHFSFSTLKMDELNVEERVDALLSLKQVAASVPDCKLTKEIIQLCEREAELLLRGINPSLLSGLRARILQLYFQFCREPKFNPEAARHLKVPQDPELLRDKLIKFNETNSYLSNWPLAVWPFAAPHNYDTSGTVFTT